VIKSIASTVAALGGAPRTFQRIFVPDDIAVLMYHAVVRERLLVPDWCFLEEGVFRAQMAYLAKHCHIVPLRELPAAVRPNGRPTVALTFDDGYQYNYGVASIDGPFSAVNPSRSMDAVGDTCVFSYLMRRSWRVSVR
jgi:hypothetical protein